MKTLHEIINHHRALSEELREYAEYAELNVQSPADLLRIIDTATQNYSQLLDELEELDVELHLPLPGNTPENTYQQTFKSWFPEMPFGEANTTQ